jgi:hypothetical protein
MSVYGHADNGTNVVPLPFAIEADVSNIALYVSGANISIHTSGTDRTDYTGYAILEYAKTTDTAVTRAQAYGNGGAGLIDGHSFVMLSADQSSGLSVGDEIEFDDEQAGNISFNSSTYQWTLSAGKTYHLSCILQILDNSTSGRMEYVWYDVTNSTALGARGAARSMDTASSYSNTSSCEAVVKPTSDITVEVQIISVNNVDLVESASSRAYIQQVA